MGKYGEQVAQAKLFGQFDALTGYEGITEADVIILKGLVTTVADQVGPRLDRIRETFPQYTEHDLRHACNVADLVYCFLPKRRPDAPESIRLNAVELALLWMAILLHDVGMYVTEQEKEETLGSKQYADFLAHHADRVEAAQRSRQQGQPRRARAIEDALLAEFYRPLHPHRARTYIDETLAKEVALEFHDVLLADHVAQLCASHGWGVERSNDLRHPEQAVAQLRPDRRIKSVRVNLQYLACCLRVGDVLDFDRSRTPLAVYEEIDFTEEKSIEEWNKHLSIDGWDVNEHRVMFDAPCTHPAYFVAVHDFLNFVDDELRACRYLLDAAPAGDAEKYALTLAHVVDRRDVRMKDPKYVAGGFRFRLEYDEILRLLMDKSLYPDPALFLRELLQNALDACRYQEALAKEAGMHDKYVPRIIVRDHSRDRKQPRIVFEDNGVGMSQQTVEDFFLRVGKSFYRSPAFEAERRRLKQQGIQLDACSLFGIGFLSCFLAGDRIEVETFQCGSVPMKVTITGPSKYYLIEKLPPPEEPIWFKSPEDEHQDGPPSQTGTRVTVQLRPDWHGKDERQAKDIVRQTLDTFAVNQEYEIRVFRPNRKRPHRIKKRRWEDMEPLPLAPSNTYERVSDEIYSILAASRVALEKWDFSSALRGSAWIWMLNDGSGGLSPAHGDLCVSSTYGDLSIEVSSAVLRQIGKFNWLGLGGTLPSEAVSLLEEYGSGNGTPNVEELSRRIWDVSSVRKTGWSRDRWDECVRDFMRMPREQRIEVVAALKRECKVHTHNITPGVSAWWKLPGIPTVLWAADREGLCDATRSIKEGCDIDRYLRVESAYKLSLFGIRVPAGIVRWDPAKGISQYQNPLPNFTTASIDAYGTAASRPSASRLFVPPENASGLLVPLGRAILRHAYELFVPHEDEPAWQSWFGGFLNSCRGIRQAVADELELLKPHIRIECVVDGKNAQLTPKELFERFGPFVAGGDWYGTDRPDGIVDRYNQPNYLVRELPIRERKGHPKEFDIRGLVPG